MLSYTDDIIVAGSHTGMISSLIHLLQKEFSFNDLGKLHYFLEIEVVKDGLFFNQIKYAIGLLDREYVINCKPTSTPL